MRREKKHEYSFNAANLSSRTMSKSFTSFNMRVYFFLFYVGVEFLFRFFSVARACVCVCVFAAALIRLSSGTTRSGNKNLLRKIKIVCDHVIHPLTSTSTSHRSYQRSKAFYLFSSFGPSHPRRYCSITSFGSACQFKTQIFSLIDLITLV